MNSQPTQPTPQNNPGRAQNLNNSDIDRAQKSDFGADEENAETNFGEQIDSEDDVEVNPSKLDTNEVDLDRSGVNFNGGKNAENNSGREKTETPTAGGNVNTAKGANVKPNQSQPSAKRQ